MNGTRMPIERGAYGNQDSTIAPELKGSVKNTRPVSRRAPANGEKGIDGSLGDFRIFNRVITEEEARLAASWPAVGRGRAEGRHRTVGRRERRVEALLSATATRAIRSCRPISTRVERRASRDRAALEHRDGARRTRRLEGRRRRCCFAECTISRASCVEAATPSFLPPMAAGLPRNRLGLARWMVDRTNPLFARVTVNRFWQELFGAGIVESADDFGVQARPPSHPELLDWLAVEFRESGWDVKKLITLMVTSAAYRQSAAISPEKLGKDPANRLLARGPRFRLDGEVVRDSALAASGLLVTKLGGPPVKPYQPAGVWEGTSMVSSNTRNYKQDTGESLYRRSLYTLWKRQAPPASMDIFDGPTREVCVVRRERTNTPHAGAGDDERSAVCRSGACACAEALRCGRRSDVETDRDRLHDASRAGAHVYGRRARRSCEARTRISSAHYRANAAAAAKLLAVGASPADRTSSGAGACGADDGGQSDLQSRRGA